MLLFKKIDFFISIALMVFFACTTRSLESLIAGYFITGGWQCISMIIHAVKKCFTRKWGARYIYHWISFVSIITLPIGSYWVLVFLAPFMAGYYSLLCFRETFIKMKERPLSLLK